MDDRGIEKIQTGILIELEWNGSKLTGQELKE